MSFNIASGEFQRLTQQAMAQELAMLLTTCQFFSLLQSIMAEQENTKPNPTLKELQTRMEELSSFETSSDSSILAEVHYLIKRVRATLAMIDGQTTVSMIRRFFERIGESDLQSLKQITKYYMSKPAKDENDRDKIDLLVTRLCSVSVTSDKNMKLRKVIDNLEEEIEQLCRSKRGAELESIQTATVARLQQIGKAILEARSLNNLMEGKLLSQFRDFKISLGENFYSPTILAEIVRLNVSIHNKFQELYYAEQARLRMETARLLRTPNTANPPKMVLDFAPSHPMVTQLNNLTLQMQQLLHDLKKGLTEQILQNRSARASIEAEGSSLSMLIASLEDSIRRSRELIKVLQDVYSKLESIPEKER
ncbi:MAG: hypothetical protein RMM17_09915 [Acidobacteriota bacterium]|nr:hypothetical protein [Blastocatellia bacterium]MDW8412984.1 hypothetical protein [Acidobacteriota bacterium]